MKNNGALAYRKLKKLITIQIITFTHKYRLLKHDKLTKPGKYNGCKIHYIMSLMSKPYKLS